MMTLLCHVLVEETGAHQGRTIVSRAPKLNSGSAPSSAAFFLMFLWTDCTKVIVLSVWPVQDASFFLQCQHLGWPFPESWHLCSGDEPPLWIWEPCSLPLQFLPGIGQLVRQTRQPDCNSLETINPGKGVDLKASSPRPDQLFF